MAARHRFARELVESAENGHAVYDQLKRELPGVFEVKPDGGKVVRAASVQAIVESGAVVLPANAPWCEQWIDEITAFLNVKNDDQTDAMVYALRSIFLRASASYDASDFGAMLGTMKLDPNEIIASINTVISGANGMVRALPDLLSGTAEHDARMHELSPRDAERIRDLDAQMATTLAELGKAATQAAERMREILASAAEN